MIATLNVVLFVLKAIETLAVLAILCLVVDFIYFEYTQWKIKDAAWKTKTDALLEKAHAEHEAVNQLLKDSREALVKAKVREDLRQQKSDEAWGSFFDDGYFRGFDDNGRLIYRGAAAPQEPDWEFYKNVDAVVDVQIFENTKEL
jgi:hypothetical protein